MSKEKSGDSYVTYKDCAEYRIGIEKSIGSIKERIAKVEVRVSLVFIAIQAVTLLILYVSGRI